MASSCVRSDVKSPSPVSKTTVSQRRITKRLQMGSAANVCHVLPRANEKKNRKTLLHFLDYQKSARPAQSPEAMRI
jgi:hypothetical protein